MQINISEQYFNPVYNEFLFDRTRIYCLYGGAGSGKSYAAAQKLILTILSNKNHGVLVCRKVANTNRYSTFALLKSIINEWNLNTLFRITQSNLYIECIYTKSYIMFLGLDNVQKLKSITGIKTVWIQQATQIKRSDLNQINLRLRGGQTGINQLQGLYHIILTFNPINKSHWIYQQFFKGLNSKRKAGRIKILKTTYLNNNFLDEQYKHQLQSLQDKDMTFYNVYCLGEWGTLGQKIYDRYNIVQFDSINILNKSSYIASGMDFGYNDPTVCVLISVYDNQLYVHHQLYERKMTNQLLSQKLKYDTFFKQYLIFADSAQPQRIAELISRNLKVVAVKKNLIKQGINNLKTMNINIHPACIHTSAQIQKYSWKKDYNDNYIDEPVGIDDHCMDALRYATIQYFLDKTSAGSKATFRSA